MKKTIICVNLDGICVTCLTAQTKQATTRKGTRTLSRRRPPIRNGLKTDTRVRMLLGSKLLMLAYQGQAKAGMKDEHYS